MLMALMTSHYFTLTRVEHLNTETEKFVYSKIGTL